MVDVVLTVFWMAIVAVFFYVKRDKYFPLEVPVADRKEVNPVRQMFWTAFGLGAIARFLDQQNAAGNVPLACLTAVLGLCAATMFLFAGIRMAYKRGRSRALGILGGLGPIGFLIIYWVGYKKTSPDS